VGAFGQLRDLPNSKTFVHSQNTKQTRNANRNEQHNTSHTYHLTPHDIMALSRFYNDPFFSDSVVHDPHFMFPAIDPDRWMLTPFAPPRFPSRFDRGWMMVPFPSTPLRTAGSKVEEDETKYSFSLQVPGFKAEDMTVTMEEAPNGGHVLLLSGKQKTETKENGNNMFTSESTFLQRFNLGRNVDTEKIDARLTDGVLCVSVAKKEAEKKPAAKVITITQGTSNKDDSSVKTVKASNKDSVE
jgi:HSP20 family protein